MSLQEQASYFDASVRSKRSDWEDDLNFAGKREFSIFIDFLKLPKGGRILEMGCGTGRYTLPLLALGYSVTAVDISKESLRRLREEYEKHKSNSWGFLDGRDSPPDRGDFDAVICINFLHHVEDLPGQIRSLRKNLKSGGILLAFEPNPYCLFWHLYFLYKRIWLIEKGILCTSRNNLRRRLLNSGFSKISLQSYGLVPTRLLGLLKNAFIFDFITIRAANMPFIKNLSFHCLVRAVNE